MEICLFSDGDRIRDGILGDDEESWSTTDLDPLALTDRIAIGSFMCSDYFPSLVEDISRFFWESFLEEFFHRDLANETEPLTIFAIRIWEVCFSRYFPNL
jgi:hypothetical protein